MEAVQSPIQQLNAHQRRRNRVTTALSGLLAALVALTGFGLLTGHVKVSTASSAVAPAPSVKPATQNCTKPMGKVGDLCATAEHEHGVTVTRTYVTQAYSTPAGKLYAYLQDTMVQLNYGDAATLDKLCTATTVASLTSDHSDYNYQRQIAQRDYCGAAQKAKSAGNSDECFHTLYDVSTIAPLVLTNKNINDACGVPAQPKAKSALVDTSALRNDTLWYNDKANYTPAA